MRATRLGNDPNSRAQSNTNWSLATCTKPPQTLRHDPSHPQSRNLGLLVAFVNATRQGAKARESGAQRASRWGSLPYTRQGARVVCTAPGSSNPERRSDSRKGNRQANCLDNKESCLDKRNLSRQGREVLKYGMQEESCV